MSMIRWISCICLLLFGRIRVCVCVCVLGTHKSAKYKEMPFSSYHSPELRSIGAQYFVIFLALCMATFLRCACAISHYWHIKWLLSLLSFRRKWGWFMCADRAKKIHESDLLWNFRIMKLSSCVLMREHPQSDEMVNITDLKSGISSRRSHPECKFHCKWAVFYSFLL